MTTNLFAYNLRSELTTAHMSTNLYAYTYDPIGNRLSSTENGATTLYAANELNQYTNALAGGRAPTYDLDGNMTSDGEHHFTWDAENRLVGVSPRVLITGSRTYSYEYDHMGRRVKKIEKRHAMAESDWGVHTFDYDAWNLLRERIQASDAMTTNQYTWGIDLSGTLQGAGGIGGLLASTLDGTNAIYTSDANGNITDLLAEDGALLAHYAYAPYGTPTAQSAPLAAPLNPFRFSSKYHDNESNLYYYGFRFYTPLSARWVSRDPLQEQGGHHLYAYLFNSPVKQIDPLGLKTYTAKPCEAVLYIGHGSDRNPIQWQVDDCAYAGAVCCYPKSNNLADDDECRWPLIPLHNGTLKGGPLGEAIAGRESVGTMANDPDAEHSFQKAVDNAMSDAAIKKIMSELCNACCDEVTFIFIVGKDDCFGKAIVTAAERHGLRYGKTTKRQQDCNAYNDSK